MRISHDFDLSATPEFGELQALMKARAMVPPDEAARTQPEFERALLAGMMRLGCAGVTMDLERLDVDADGVEVDGERFRRRAGKTTGHYMTSMGKVEVERSTYRARGGHGGRTIAPLELRLGLVDGHWTLAAAEIGSAFMAAVPSEASASLLEMVGGMCPSASHLDRLPKRISEVWETHREALEEAVRESAEADLPPVEDVALIAVSLDGIMVPMKDAPRERSPDKQASGPKGHREVGCASLTMYDAEGERLHTIRFGRMPEKHKVTLHSQMQAELGSLVERYPAASLAAIADGAADNWRILDAIADEIGRPVERVLDYWHAVEHFDLALKKARVSKKARSEWRRAVRDDEDGVERLIAELGAHVAQSTGNRRALIEREFEYLVKHADRMDYPRLAAEKCPIGSGVQEGVCKSLVADRMKCSGMTWLQAGGQAILTSRGWAQSGRLRHAWRALRRVLVRKVEIDVSNERKRPQWSAAA